MRFLVKVKVNVSKMAEFGKKLQNNELDRSYIKSETFCLKADPAVGYSVWEAESRDEFDRKFAPWSGYYEDVEVSEVISPMEAMTALASKTS